MSQRLFTICCLFYGDYPELMERLFRSLYKPVWFPYFELRCGHNNLSRRSAQLFQQWADKFYDDGPMTMCVKGETPYYKDPMIRRLIHTTPNVNTPNIMWFDDDSYVKPGAPDDWLQQVAKALYCPDMVGAPYEMRLQGNQHLWIKDQPWYTGEPVKKNDTVRFITGGWWACKSEVLLKHDWPPKEFHHNGSDVLLGALCKQQHYQMNKFTDFVGINCDHTGECSSAPRRGASLPPFGVDYKRKKNWLDVIEGK